MRSYVHQLSCLCLLLIGGLVLSSSTAFASVDPDYAQYLTQEIKKREQASYQQVMDLMDFHISTDQSNNEQGMDQLANQMGSKSSPAFSDFNPMSIMQNMTANGIMGKIGGMMGGFNAGGGFSGFSMSALSPNSSNAFTNNDKAPQTSCIIASATPATPMHHGAFVASPIAAILATPIAGGGAANEPKVRRKDDHFKYNADSTNPDQKMPSEQYGDRCQGSADSGCGSSGGGGGQ